MTPRVLAASLAALAGLAVAAPTAGATDYFATTDNSRTTQDCLTEATACALGRALSQIPNVPLDQQSVGVHVLTLLPGGYDVADILAGDPSPFPIDRFDVKRGLTVQGKPGAAAPTVDVSGVPAIDPGIRMDNGGILRHLHVVRNGPGVAVRAAGLAPDFSIVGATATVDRVAISVDAPADASVSVALDLREIATATNSLFEQSGGKPASTFSSAAVSIVPGVGDAAPRLLGSTALSATGIAVAVSGGGTATSTAAAIKNAVLRGAVDLEARAVASPSSPVTVELTNSAWRNAAPQTATTGPATIDAKTTPVSADPKLDGGGKPLEGSPLIDAGTALSELGSLDLDGNARVQGAATDIGAFEVAPGAPPGTGPQPTTPTAGGTPSPPPGPSQPAADTSGPVPTFTLGKSLKRSKLTARKGVTLAVKLNEPVKSAKVELIQVTKKKGKKPKEKVLASSILGPGGPDLAFRLKAKPSKLPKSKTKLTLRFTFVDAAGNTTVVDKTVSV